VVSLRFFVLVYVALWCVRKDVSTLGDQGVFVVLVVGWIIASSMYGMRVFEYDLSVVEEVLSTQLASGFTSVDHLGWFSVCLWQGNLLDMVIPAEGQLALDDCRL
jgi:hypothetical protein